MIKTSYCRFIKLSLCKKQWSSPKSMVYEFLCIYRPYLSYFLHILCIFSVIFTLCYNFYIVWM